MTDATHDTIIEEKIKEDIKRKDWTSPQWMNSKDDMDRLIWYISSLSPHNLWKAREIIRSALQEAYTKGKEDTAREIVDWTDDIEVKMYANASLEVWKLFKHIRNRLREKYFSKQKEYAE